MVRAQGRRNFPGCPSGSYDRNRPRLLPRGPKKSKLGIDRSGSRNVGDVANVTRDLAAALPL